MAVVGCQLRGGGGCGVVAVAGWRLLRDVSDCGVLVVVGVGGCGVLMAMGNQWLLGCWLPVVGGCGVSVVVGCQWLWGVGGCGRSVVVGHRWF